MSKRRQTGSTPDLFSAEASKALPPAERKIAPPAEVKSESPTGPIAYLLPSDLPNALKRLVDEEIDKLLAAVTDEAKRRGRLPAEVTQEPVTNPANPPVDKVPRAAALKKSSPRRSQGAADYPEPTLTVAKTNAVRAAFMAGVKPSTIARQFGISQAAVRQVLAAEKRGRKP